MTRDKAFAKFQDVVADVLDVDPATVTAGARWDDDLGADSLAVVEITLALNDEFDIKLPDADPEDIETVGAAFDLLAATVGLPAG